MGAKIFKKNPGYQMTHPLRYLHETSYLHETKSDTSKTVPGTKYSHGTLFHPAPFFTFWTYLTQNAQYHPNINKAVRDSSILLATQFVGQGHDLDLTFSSYFYNILPFDIISIISSRSRL